MYEYKYIVCIDYRYTCPQIPKFSVTSFREIIILYVQIKKKILISIFSNLKQIMD